MNDINELIHQKYAINSTDSSYYMNRIDKNSILNDICFGPRMYVFKTL